MQVRYANGQNVIARSVVGSPDCMLEYTKDLKRKAEEKIRNQRKERRLQRRQ